MACLFSFIIVDFSWSQKFDLINLFGVRTNHSPFSRPERSGDSEALAGGKASNGLS
jgi:hypothetical protein